MAGQIDSRLQAIGIALPEAPAPRANYIPYVVAGNLVFVSGQVSVADGTLISGKLGADLDIAAGQKAARACALNLVAQLKAACGGDLDRVRRVVKLGGFVNATADFTDAPQVINGASDVLVEIFGEAGRHARFAVCAASLPSGCAVEIDGVFEIE